jgi:hypothetical protein
MAKLARKLRLADYFALAFGTMVGVGWLVLMDDWLGRGGPVGDGVSRLADSVASCRLRLRAVVQRLPDAAGEAAYTAQVLPDRQLFHGLDDAGVLHSFARGKRSPGKLAAYIFPWLNSDELYRVAANPSFCLVCAGYCADTVSRATELSRHSTECQFSELDDDGSTATVCRPAGHQRGVWSSSQFSSGFQAAPGFPVLTSDRPVFHDGFESAPRWRRKPADFLRRGSFVPLRWRLSWAQASMFWRLPQWLMLRRGKVVGKRFVTAIAFEEALGADGPSD